MHRSFLLALALYSSSALAAKCYGAFTNTQFPDCKQLDPKFAVHWAIEKGSITLGLSADASADSWYAFGISENGGMNGADIVALIKDAGKWSASSRFSLGMTLPAASKQDWTLVQEPTFANGTASAVVTRKLRTCSEPSQEIRLGFDHNVIWAIGSAASFGQHAAGSRGNNIINFQLSAAQKADAEALAKLDRSSYKSVDILMPKVKVPSKLTSYICMAFELPADQKYHAVEYEALIPNDYVHHILIYQCSGKPSHALNTAWDCNSGSESSCSTLIFQWSPGQDYIRYPSVAGLPFGKGVMQYGYMSTHYNNAKGLSNLVDSSGLRFIYTPKLRQYDVGIIYLGPFSLNLTPGKESVDSGESSCKHASGGDLTLMTNVFHMHSWGRKMITRKIRGKEELKPLGQRKYYDYNFQGTEAIEPDAQILKAGDVLVTKCSYDTRTATKTITWSEGSDGEMCNQFIQYYPRLASNPTVCSGGSAPSGYTKYSPPVCVASA